MPEIIEIECPKCKEPIKILHIPRYFSEHYARAASNKKVMPQLHPERNEAMTPCLNCGASVIELNRLLKQGKDVSVKDAYEKAKSLGLPTRF